MKKIIIYIFSMLMLCGCTNNDNNSNKLIEDIKLLAQENISYTNNHNKKLYSYYLDPTTISTSTNETSSIINYDNNTIILDIDINNILDKKLYNNNDKVKQVKIKGTRLIVIDDLLIDYHKEPINYIFEIYELNDQYLISLKTKLFKLESIQPKINVDIISNKMMIIAKSINIDIDKVILDYSNKIEIYTKKENIELYKPLAPVDGPISEILSEEQVDEYLDKYNGNDIKEEIPDNEDIINEEDEYIKEN